VDELHVVAGGDERLCFTANRHLVVVRLANDADARPTAAPGVLGPHGLIVGSDE
jgi:hypothetical protein